MQSTHDHDTGWMTDLLVIFFGVGTFYLLWLGSYPLFTPDEGRYSEVAREMVMSGDYITPRLNGIAFFDKPILYYLLQASAIKWFGLNEWSLRFWPALIGLIGCIAMYSCGRLLYDRRTGFLSSILLATCPLYYGAAHYANLDLEVAVFISTTLLCFITAVTQPEGKLRTTLLLFAYFSAALATLTKGLIGIAFPVLIIGSWIALLRNWRLLRQIHLFVGILLFFIITAPWFVMVQQKNSQFFHYFFVLQQISRFLTKADFNNQAVSWFYIPVVLAGFFPWTVFLLQALTQSIISAFKNSSSRSISLFLLLWFAIIFTFFSIPSSKTVGYILPVIPPIALLTGNYLSKNWNQWYNRSIQGGVYAFIFVTLISGIFLLTIPNYHSIKLDVVLMPYAMLAGVLLILASFACYVIRAKKSIVLFCCFALTTCFALLILIHAASSINTRSIKPLAEIIKKELTPQDEIITYYRYYQDLPIYLERRITIVADWHSPDIMHYDNWQRELWYNMHYVDSSAWLIEKYALSQRWRGSHRIFLLMHSDFFLPFLRDIQQDNTFKPKVYYLGSLPLVDHRSVILLSNQP